MLTQYGEELKQMGYSIAHKSDSELVGVRSKWYLDCYATKLTLIVFVKHIASLDENKIKDDIEKAIALSETYDKSFLPLGFQRGRAVIPIYLSNDVSPGVKTFCSDPQPVRFSLIVFPAVFDLSYKTVHYLRKTPIIGSVYFPKLRYLVQRLIDPAKAAKKEPISCLGIIFGSISLVLFLLIMGIFFYFISWVFR
jgi:hypothetical protein